MIEIRRIFLSIQFLINYYHKKCVYNFLILPKINFFAKIGEILGSLFYIYIYIYIKIVSSLAIKDCKNIKIKKIFLSIQFLINY